MLSAYVFSLVLGGSFLLVSVLGDLFGADADLDTDLDADLDLDFEADVEVADAGEALEAVEAGEAADGTAAAKIFSIRGLIYALFGFGAVGSILTWLGDASSITTLVAAVVGGILTGGMVTVVFNWLKSTGATTGPGDRGFVGLQGTITLPVGENSTGTVAVERGGRRITLRALPWPGAEGDCASWRNVVVMEMERGVARVAPLEEDLALGP